MIPKIFVLCSNYNNGCPKTREIMNEFYEKIEPEELEMRSDLDPKSAIKVDNVVKEISNFYCSNCDSFKFSLSDT